MNPRRLLEHAGLTDALSDADPTPLAGGDISAVHRVGPWVTKSYATPQATPPGLFESEAAGLRALSDAGVRVPTVRWVGPDGIVMNYLSPGPDDPRALAEQVARLHHTAAEAYGWPGPVFLGSFPLPRSPDTFDWADFWRTYRIRPLLDATRPMLGPLADGIERWLERFVPQTEGPCLIHGDLWRGNVLMTDAGPALIDPSVWRGERVVDLAMMRLFGGFGDRFWDAYRALYPIPSVVERGIPFHQLYFVLVHVHLFGAAYLGHVRRLLTCSR